MGTTTLNVVILYVTDATIGVLFVIGLASCVEYFAKRAVSRILIQLSPRQIAHAIFAQIGVVLLALLGFKYVVLSGGPGIATKKILSTSNLTQGYSLAALVLGGFFSLVGLFRLLRMIKRAAQIVKYSS